MKYITYEQAKWLDKIGYKNGSTICYDIQGNPTVPYYGTKFYNGENNGDGVYEAPEQHELVDWLLEEHNIWVEVRRTSHFNEIRFQAYYNEKPVTGIMGGYLSVLTPQEAYNTAFDHIRENVIIRKSIM
jgi:hypothetical protein